MFACHRPRSNGNDGERFSFGALNGPRFACAKEAGDHLVLDNPDRGILVASEQAQYGKRHVRTTASGTGCNHFGTRPATADGIERQSQICIVLVGVVALNFKVLSGINKSATGFAYRIGVPYIYVAAQSRAQQRVESTVHGDNVIALPC